MFAVVAIVSVAHASTFVGDFVWDDHPLIQDQRCVQELAPLPTYFDRMFWSNPLDPGNRSFYRPLTTLSYALNHQMAQGKPWVFRVTNLVAHLLVCLLVFALAELVGAAPLPAAAAALLFGLAPRLTESVAWISGRTDVFAAGLGIAAILLHRRAGARLGLRVAAAGALLAGLLFKEIAIAALVTLVAWDFLESAGATRLDRLKPLWLQTVALAIYMALRLWAAARTETPPEATTRAPDVLTAVERPLAALESLGHYVLMVLDPLRPRIRIGTWVDIPYAANVAPARRRNAGAGPGRRRLDHQRRRVAAPSSVGLGVAAVHGAGRASARR